MNSFKKGFTLVETLLAMMILSSALLLLTQSWSGSFLRIKKTQTQFEVAALLERKMSELDLEYRGKSLDDIPEEKEGDFGEEYPQYSWKIESKKLEIPDLSATMASQDGGVDEFTASLVKQLSEGLSKSVKELTLTVILQVPKGKPLQYSVTTYYVDYDKDFNLAIPTGS